MIKLPTLTCVRCNWTWTPRIKNPWMCPHCHGPYDRPLKPKTDKAPEAQKD
jgi:rubrerythrin